MALVKAPFFSTWASGSFGKTLTVNALFDGNKFSITKFKSRSGKRHPIQEYNAQVFKERMEYVRKTFRE